MRVTLVRAWSHRRQSTEVEVGDAACVRDAMDAAGWSLDADFVGVGIFGVLAQLDTRLHAGDRIELLRALHLNPKQARRLRAERSQGLQRDLQRLRGKVGKS